MPLIVRRMVAIFLLIAAGGLLLACGKSARLDSAKSTTVTKHAKKPSEHAKKPSAPPAPPADARTRARAKKLALALNLKASDLPGFTATSGAGHETLAEKGLGEKLKLCMGGAPSSDAWAKVGSTSFERYAQAFHASVSSSVTIVATPAQAIAELKALRGEHARACLTSFMRGLLGGQAQDGASAKLVAIKGETPLFRDASGTFAWSITGQLTLQGVTAKFYIELAGFAYGHAEVELLSFGLPLPFPGRDERELFSLLLARAQAGGAEKRGKGLKRRKEPNLSGPQRVQISL